MDRPLNLTPERGPSVWTNTGARHSYWQSAIVTGGSLLAAYAFRSRSRNRTWLAGLGLGAMAYGLYSACPPIPAADRVTGAIRRLRPPRAAELDEIDLASKQSFPASDPPPMR